MRISVLAGLFACAVIFVANSASAEAATQNNLEATNGSTITTIERLEAVTEIAKSPLLTLSDNKDAEVVKETKIDEPIKYVVGESETLSTIAEKYNTTWKRIYDKNTNIETPDIINPGEEIIIPTVDETIAERALPVVEPIARITKSTTTAIAVSTSSTYTVSRGSSSGNGYVAGYCTWYVKSRRPDLPNSLGNAYAWISNAAAQGLATGSTPRVGAAAQRNNHVAYVEAINADGTITISDMNYQALYAITTRVVNPAEWRYIY